MQNLRRLALPAYLMAALLVLFPLLDTTLSVLPARMGEVSWRFGAAGLFSRALMTPLLGLLLAYAVALVLEQRRVLRIFAALSGVLGIVLLGMIGLFILDALQMRAQVRPEAKTPFDVATATALTKYGLGLVVVAAFTFCGWKSSGKSGAGAASGARSGREASSLLVGSRAPV